MNKTDYKVIVDTIPRLPGIYQFKNKDGKILYVGKAKNLRNRLNSYFSSPKQQAAKTKTLVKNAHYIDFMVVDSETDALLLEASLIKKHQPRYNVMLKDGKSYAYICIKNERFPRVFSTRKVIRDGSIYFGPYTSKQRLDTILEMIKTLFQLRTCNLNLEQSQIDKGKYKVCLEFHIKNCAAPCVNKEDEASYNAKIDQIKNILKGHFSGVKQYLHDEMGRLAANLDFERANEAKIKLEAFQDYQFKSSVVSTTIRDVDVFDITSDKDSAYVSYIKVINGAINHSFPFELTKNLNTNDDEILAYAVSYMREKFGSISHEVILPRPIKLLEVGIEQTIPKIGDKKKLLDLATNNVKYFMLQRKKEQVNNRNRQTPSERILRTLQSDLQLKELPIHIECFDNSNIMGDFPVSSCVVFLNGRPAKREYRHFNIKTVVGPDDFASMTEVVERRYKRLLKEDKPLPQLVIIDGGKGQLSAAMKSIDKLGIADRMVVIGIAKRLEEIFFPNDSVPLYIDKKSESLKLIQHLRNEAHRFAITFHRDQRSRGFLQTELTEIPGIGTLTAEKLLTEFGSVTRVREATPTHLQKIVGPALTRKIKDYFEEKDQSN